MADATFYYDFSSPYAYFTANRIARGFPVAVRWQPILFGGLIIIGYFIYYGFRLIG